MSDMSKRVEGMQERLDEIQEEIDEARADADNVDNVDLSDPGEVAFT